MLSVEVTARGVHPALISKLALLQCARACRVHHASPGVLPLVSSARVEGLVGPGGMGPAEIARTLKIGRASVYRKLDELLS